MSKESSETSFTKGLPDGRVVSYVERKITCEFIAVVLFLHLLLHCLIGLKDRFILGQVYLGPLTTYIDDIYVHVSVVICC
ncbi:unnamed protein product [Brassica napus]|uniref:(rape) hypothetical protein n=1 Tax=Brassica napus TaxID=3708 RepID=A0A816MYH0_BRANA|nr:unnamed protein product [Brassica napus]